MFAVVEFDNIKKEYSIVPLIWLSDDKSSCMWPRNIKSEAHLQTMVEELCQPKPSWTYYGIKQIHVTKETYSEANSAMQHIIAESSSCATDAEADDREPHKIVIEKQQSEGEMSVSNEDNHEDHTKNKKNKTKKRLRHPAEPTYSSDSDNPCINTPKRKRNEIIFSELDCSDDSGEDHTIKYTGSAKPSVTPSILLNHSDDSQISCAANLHPYNASQHCSASSTNPIVSRHSLPSGHASHDLVPNLNLQSSANISSPISSRNSSVNHKYSGHRGHSSATIVDNSRSSGTTPLRSPLLHSLRTDLAASQNIQQQPWQAVVRELQQIKIIQDQHSTMLSQIWQAVQLKNVQALQPPKDRPDLPIERLRDFGTFENWLQNEQNYVYMRARLASIGGTTVRGAVMNIMKFVLSNRVGMAFNWAGSTPKSPNQNRKYAFKETHTCKVINEAAKLCFNGTKDMNDKNIALACQDWLKQAKHRWQHQTSK